MQQLRPNGNGNAGSADQATDTPRSGKLRAEDLGYFNLDYESENNKPIISAERYIYYRNIFV